METAAEPRVAWVRHAADVTSLTCPENVTSVEMKIISVCVVGPGTEKIPKTETDTDQPIEVANTPESHEARGEAGTDVGDIP